MSTQPVLTSQRLGWGRSRYTHAGVRVHQCRQPLRCVCCDYPILAGDLFIWRTGWHPVCRACHPFDLPPQLERRLPR